MYILYPSQTLYVSSQTLNVTLKTKSQKKIAGVHKISRKLSSIQIKIRPAGPFASGEINEAQLTDGAALGHVDFAIAARMSFDHPEKMFIHRISLNTFSLAPLHHLRRDN